MNHFLSLLAVVMTLGGGGTYVYIQGYENGSDALAETPGYEAGFNAGSEDSLKNMMFLMKEECEDLKAVDRRVIGE